MLLPRPEMRIPTRLGSRIVGGGPSPGRAPAASIAADRAAAFPRLDPADAVDRLSGLAQLVRERVGVTRGGDDRHADAAIERPRHFGSSDLSALLKERKNRRQRPVTNIYDSVANIWQNTRNILE